MKACGLLIALFFCLYASSFASPVSAAEIEGTTTHDWTPGAHIMDAPCSERMPCNPSILGTEGDDLIRGLSGWDRIGARGGDDVVWGALGMDLVYGGTGNDVLKLGKGHDHAWGVDGNDHIYLADGQDEAMHIEAAQCGEGNDTARIDEDPVDGAIIHQCEHVVIEDLPGLSGKTPIYMGEIGHEANDPKFYLPPGDYPNGLPG